MPVTFGNGRQTVTTGGTAVQLTTTSTAATKVTITAETDNTGIITVGSSTVVGALATRQGVPLTAGSSYTIECKGLEALDISKIYLDTTVDTDGVTYTYQAETWRNQA